MLFARMSKQGTTKPWCKRSVCLYRVAIKFFSMQCLGFPKQANDQGRNRCRHVEASLLPMLIAVWMVFAVLPLLPRQLKLRNTIVEEDRQFNEAAVVAAWQSFWPF